MCFAVLFLKQVFINKFSTDIIIIIKNLVSKYTSYMYLLEYLIMVIKLQLAIIKVRVQGL